MREGAKCTKDPDLWFSGHKNDIDLAKKICATCPMKQTCLEDVLEYEKLSGELRWGIFGGMTKQERRRLQPV